MNSDGAADALAALADPALSLRAYGKVHDQSTGREIPYDPFKITEKLQATVVSYFSNPPKTEFGQTKWLTLLG